MVITLHSGMWHTDFMASGTWQRMLQFCIRLVLEGVPVFMLVNGFLMFDKKFDGKKHLRRTLNVVLIILIWSVLMDLFFTLLEGKPLSIRSVARTVLNTSISDSHTGVLWFLQKLVVIYLVFPVLKHLYDTRFSLFTYLLAVLFVSTYTINFVSLLTNFTQSELLKSVLFFLNRYSVVFTDNIYIIYFMLGGFLYRNMDKLPHKLCMIAGAVCTLLSAVFGVAVSVHQGATFSVGYNYSQVFLFFTILGMFLLCSHLPLNNPRVNKVLASIGDNTMGIYLLHRMVIFGINRWVSVTTLPFLYRFAVSFGVLLISWGLTVLIRKIPKVSFLVKL